MVRTQLTHEKVQKSTSTTLPRSPPRVSGGLLIQPSSPVKSAAVVLDSAGISAALPMPVAALGGADCTTQVSRIANAATPATAVRAQR